VFLCVVYAESEGFCDSDCAWGCVGFGFVFYVDYEFACSFVVSAGVFGDLEGFDVVFVSCHVDVTLWIVVFFVDGLSGEIFIFAE